ncbi:hypothetical protein FRC02_012343 [Tulasnella sp. 418]|nr:hypothetical protein FRC02_012343 [Tulasnella sp. 418]
MLSQGSSPQKRGFKDSTRPQFYGVRRGPETGVKLECWSDREQIMYLRHLRDTCFKKFNSWDEAIDFVTQPHCIQHQNCPPVSLKPWKGDTAGSIPSTPMRNQTSRPFLGTLRTTNPLHPPSPLASPTRQGTLLSSVDSGTTRISVEPHPDDHCPPFEVDFEVPELVTHSSAPQVAPLVAPAFLGLIPEMYIGAHFASATHAIRQIFSENRDLVGVREALCNLGLRNKEAELLWRMVKENQNPSSEKCLMSIKEWIMKKNLRKLNEDELQSPPPTDSCLRSDLLVTLSLDVTEQHLCMPRSHYYNGSARQQRKQKAPKVDREMVKARSALQRERNRKFNAAVRELTSLIDTNIKKIKEEHGRSEVFIQTALGISGPEFRGSNRKVSLYNAWLKGRMAEVNNERSDNGEEKLTLPDFKKMYGSEYEEIKDDEEKCQAYLNGLEKTREENTTSARKYHQAAQLDINSTMNDMFGLAQQLEQRTGYLVSIFSHKGSVESNAMPQCHIPQAMENFLDTVIKKDVAAFLLNMEAWAMQGPEAVAKTSRVIHAEMRKTVVALLKNSLEKAAGRSPIRMYYANFLQQVVIPNCVDIVGWPLKKMIDPSRMTTHDLQLVHQGLASQPPTIYFKKLTQTELQDKRKLLKEEQKKGEKDEGRKFKKRRHEELDSSRSSLDTSESDDNSRDGDSECDHRQVTKKTHKTKSTTSNSRQHHRSASVLGDTDTDEI